MSTRKPAPPRPPTSDDVEHYLQDLKLAFMAEHYRDLAQQAAHQHWAHLDYLGQLVEGEARLRQDRATQRRIRLARFPVMKTLDQFRWDWPTQINRELIQHHFTLSFLKAHMNRLCWLMRDGQFPSPCMRTFWSSKVVYKTAFLHVFELTNRV